MVLHYLSMCKNPINGGVDETIELMRRSDVKVRDNGGNTPLHVATLYNNHHMIQCLIYYDPAITMYRNDRGFLPLKMVNLSDPQSHYEVDFYHMVLAFSYLQRGDIGRASNFIKLMNSVGDVDLQGKGILHHLAMCKEDVGDVNSIPWDDLEVNKKDNRGDTPLHTAARHCASKEIVRSMLEHGADKEAINNDGWTPQAYVFGKCEKMVELLRVEEKVPEGELFSLM